MQVLPDSSGRQLMLIHHLRVDYDGAGGSTFNVSDEITGQDSGTVGTVNRVVSVDINTGYLIVTLDAVSLDNELVFQNDENIQVGGSTIAIVNGSPTDLYVQPTTIVGATNPDNGLAIDARGAALVRFLEGQAQLDAFGSLQVSQKHSVGNYIYDYDLLPSFFETSISGSATITYESASVGALLSNSGVDGDLVQRTTHLYHVFQPGASQLIMMTTAMGDTGKANLVRRWGYYDDQDGLFFELSGTTMNVVKRSSTSGVEVETRIPQSSWNIDKVDGSKDQENLSLFTLDPSMNNIYWVDFQWLGAGRVRYGVNIDGQRIAVHEFNHANNAPRTYMRSGKLPIRYEQINSGTVGSTSEMRFFCSTVATENPFRPRTQTSFAASLPNEALPGNLFNKIVHPRLPGRAVLTVRAQSTFKSKTNRAIGIPRTLSINVSSGSAVAVSVYRSCALTGTINFVSLGDNSPFEVDYTAEVDEANLGEPVGHWILVSPGSENVDLSSIFGIDKENITLNALGGNNSRCYTFLTHNLSNPLTTTPFSASFGTSPNEIIRPTGDFTADGFASGMGIFVSGSDNNYGYYVLDSISALTMSLRISDTLLPEGPIDGVVVEGGEVSLAHFTLNVEEFL
jgi:hypothetical protein